MWKYSQSLKTLFHDKILVTDDGYSGFGDGKNKPNYECVPNVGPIPSGRYKIGSPYTHPTKGPIVMKLTPIGHDACGRMDFLIHGDSRLHPGEASLGCIILKIIYRKMIADSHDRDLEVIR